MRLIVSDRLQYVRNGWRVRYWVPQELRSFVGQEVITRHTGVYGPKNDRRLENQARQASHPIIAKIDAELAVIKKDPQAIAAGILAVSNRPWGLMGIAHLPPELQEPVRRIVQAEYDRQNEQTQEVARLHSDILKNAGDDPDSLRGFLHRLPGKPNANSQRPADYESIINLWKDERIAEGKPPSKKAVEAKRGPMKLLFDWLHQEFGLQGYDMRSVQPEHLQAYKEYLMHKKNI